MTEVGLESRLDRVAATLTPTLEKAYGWRTVEDLLRHYPRSYVRKGDVSDLAALEEGDLIAFVGRVVSTSLHAYNDRRTGRQAWRVESVVEAGGSRLGVTFFARHQAQADWRKRSMQPGDTGFVQGKVSRFRDQWQLAHPVFEKLDEAGSSRGLEAERRQDELPDLRAVYALAGSVEHADLVRAIGFALAVLEPVPDVVPEPDRVRLGLVDADQALRWIHRADDWPQQRAARQRLALDEALVTQTVLARRRAAYARVPAVPRPGRTDGALAAFDARLPFALTRGQQAVGEELDADLARSRPMLRLLQGEVGSGKTLVALRAMLRVVDSGGQAALLAPTEVLAQQHARSIRQLLGDLAQGGMLGGSDHGTRVALVTGSAGVAARREALLDAASGAAGIVVGTHALLEDQVQFADLGLVVVDEQHRFGVEQRAALTAKAEPAPHVLVMTATPIPRTVAMTVFGDLETSTLRELPAGRRAIQTTVVPALEQPAWVERAWARVREEVAQGRQAYVVCPKVASEDPVREVDRWGRTPSTEESAQDRVLAAVEAWAPALAAGPLAGLRVEMLHGQLPSADKDAVMQRFAAGGTDVLVATTVIEVGVDVPNATAMVVLDADMYGVSQLHQLRGRVGRGEHGGLCLLLTQAAPGTPARERLDAVARSNDGFELSRFDLEQRREGDVLGAAQSGRGHSLRLLSVLADEDLIEEAREIAERLVAADPDLSDEPALRAAVEALERSEGADFLDKS